MIAHGVARGSVSVLQGGKFKSGFASGFLGHAAGGLTRAVTGAMNWAGQTAVIVRTMMAATVGGTVSQLTGGKFANGSISAAFVHLFNVEAIQKIKKLFVGNLRITTNGMTRNSLSFIGGRKMLVEGTANAAFGHDSFYYRANYYEYDRGGHEIGHVYPVNAFGQRSTTNDIFHVHTMNYGVGATGYSREHYASPSYYAQENFVRWDIQIPPQMLSNYNSGGYELNVYQILD